MKLVCPTPLLLAGLVGLCLLTLPSSAHWLTETTDIYGITDGYVYHFYDDGDDVEICFDGCWQTTQRTSIAYNANGRYHTLSLVETDGHIGTWTVDVIDVILTAPAVLDAVNAVKTAVSQKSWLAAIGAIFAVADAVNSVHQTATASAVYRELWPQCNWNGFYPQTTTLLGGAKMTTGYMHGLAAYYVYAWWGMQTPLISNSAWCKKSSKSHWNSQVNTYFEPFGMGYSCIRSNAECTYQFKRNASALSGAALRLPAPAKSLQLPPALRNLDDATRAKLTRQLRQEQRQRQRAAKNKEDQEESHADKSPSVTNANRHFPFAAQEEELGASAVLQEMKAAEGKNQSAHAAGVVVGIVAACAAGGALVAALAIVFWRRRQRQLATSAAEQEEEEEEEDAA